jgi:selenocysteine lyase/cysteine desulfurase
MEFSEIRKAFPGLNDKTFLDAACVGLLSVHSKKAVDDFLDVALHCRAEDASAHHIQMDRMRLEAIEEAAKLLHVRPQNIGLIESTSHGLNIAANSINLTEGNEILIADTEFLQVSIPWIKKQERVGVKVKEVKTNGKLSVKDFERCVNQKTKVICISSVQWCTGQRIDLGAFGALCQERGIWLVVDGVHELGAMDVDLRNNYCDFYIAGGHKWLNSPLGCGLMYVSQRVLDELEPNSYGYLALEEPKGGWGTYFRTPSITPFNEFTFLHTAKKFEIGGTSNYPGAVAIGKSLSLINSIGIKNIERRIVELSDFLHRELDQLKVTKITSADLDVRSGITVFSYFNNAEKDLLLLQKLLERRVYASLRYTSYVGGIRVSTHFYNNEDDILKLIHEIKSITR